MTHHRDPDRGVPGWYMIDEIELIGMVVDHAGLTRLCAELEAVANRLPEPPDREQAARLRRELLERLPVHDARGRALGARLGEVVRGRPVGRALLRRVEDRRAACIVQGQDVAAALGPGPSPHTPETLGYMLRCFFDACRQAIEFEELVILHLFARRLTHDAQALLVRSLVRRCMD